MSPNGPSDRKDLGKPEANPLVDSGPWSAEIPAWNRQAAVAGCVPRPHSGTDVPALICGEDCRNSDENPEPLSRDQVRPLGIGRAIVPKYGYAAAVRWRVNVVNRRIPWKSPDVDCVVGNFPLDLILQKSERETR